jgi:peroxiredoxin
LLALLVGFFYCPAAKADKDPWKEMHVLRFDGSKKSQNFKLKDMEGSVRKLSDYRGKVVLLAFWATYCPPCIKEMPALNRLYQKWNEKGLVILGISLDEKLDHAKKFLRSNQVDFPVLWDEDLKVGQDYRVYALPITFIINERGGLVGAAVGMREWDSRSAHALIASLVESSKKD